MYAEGYELLSNILQDAFEQASTGKGKERHGRGLPWHEQAIFTLGRQYGPGGTGFQAAKKIGEAMGMIERGDYEAAEREILGTIVYAAATVALVREKAKEPIPEKVEWDEEDQKFHDHGKKLCYVSGSKFYEKWFPRRTDFPKWKTPVPADYEKEPIPEGYEWEPHTLRFYDTFQNAYVSIVGEFHSKWIERRGEFPIRRRFIK